MNRISKLMQVTVAGAVWSILVTVSGCQPQQQQPAQAQPNSQQPQGQLPSPEHPFDIAARFTASGWMGDGEPGTKFTQLNEGWKDNPHSAPGCIKAVYSPGPNGWGGIYWQNKPDNRGDMPGEDFSHAGFNKLSFWARGETGDELIEFKAGGSSAPGKPYQDSFEISAGKIQLEKEWKQYTLNLAGQNLSCVIGGFGWVAAKTANPDGATFYLDDVFFEH